MTIFTCGTDFAEMMTCIYDAWASKLGHANVRLMLEPVEQTELFCDYIHVAPDEEKTGRVIRSIQQKISFEAYQWVYRAAMSCDKERLDTIYRFLIFGFAYGKDVLHMLSAQPVARMLELSRRVGNEAHFFREFARFDRAAGGVYVSHIEPKANVLTIVAAHFADRMPSEHWLLIDDGRRLAAAHPRDEAFYVTELAEEELEKLRETERQEDIYTHMWQEFFDTIGIEARRNPCCQRTLMPLWYRKHVTEFRQKQS
ncbi:MAG: TIGR03915 family putative DNA repair protein [Eubacteriales bacterium]|nr:TIGR03915 family putative DNA repair protein [Eubacteriales bacterium]